MEFKVGDEVKIINNNSDDVIHNWTYIVKVDIPFKKGSSTKITSISKYPDGKSSYYLNNSKFCYPITVFQKQSKTYEIYY